MIVRDDENEEDRRQRACTEASRADIPQGALELAQSFRVFHKLMVTSREIFKKASANIVLYTEQQKVINHVSYAKNSIFFLGNSWSDAKLRNYVDGSTGEHWKFKFVVPFVSKISGFQLVFPD